MYAGDSDFDVDLNCKRQDEELLTQAKVAYDAAHPKKQEKIATTADGSLSLL